MCGIIGYTGHRPAIPAIVEGLRRPTGEPFAEDRTTLTFRGP